MRVQNKALQIKLAPPLFSRHQTNPTLSFSLNNKSIYCVEFVRAKNSQTQLISWICFWCAQISTKQFASSIFYRTQSRNGLFQHSTAIFLKEIHVILILICSLKNKIYSAHQKWYIHERKDTYFSFRIRRLLISVMGFHIFIRPSGFFQLKDLGHFDENRSPTNSRDRLNYKAQFSAVW
jgi:hypothetical protein